MKNTVTLSVIGCLLLLISACGNKEMTEIVEETPNEPKVEEVVEEKEEEEVKETFTYTFPLTGVGTNEEINRRVIGVTINNAPQARPQTGLVDADLVYEVLAEGDVTRFVALYQSTLPEKVGPVRSARPYHIDLINGYDALMVLHGWSPEAERLLTGGKADFLNGLFYDGTLFQRSSDRKAPHNSYITFENIVKGLEDRGYEITGDVPSLVFAEESERLTGADAKEITVTYNRYQVDYIFNEETGMYQRFNGENQTVDHETGEELSVANLLVAEMDHRVLDDVGRRAINLTSGGKALLFQDGNVEEVQWKNDDGRIIAVKDGEPVPLKPGQTWINIIPTSPGIDENVTY
ncbi:DUF3048 domain-containing protein [Halalkalibacter urbisdiaboli]|uniref:DUF3048 domain-containing protein n=1 Tax=Halalkalibacter urbisdiaboli TaxID=1960589 RepID=UPI001A98A784|nr:DUF3048 domain-containing protein [Halalkalibacter urbisdiaboli]